LKGDTDAFWDKHSSKVGPTFFTSEFKSLINGMIHSDPDKRFTVGDVLSHSWMQGMTATSKEVLTEFNERLSEI
jgi:serine/threonine protein kinase